MIFIKHGRERLDLYSIYNMMELQSKDTLEPLGRFE